MDVWTIIGGLGIVVGIVAGVVQIVEYVQGRREKPAALVAPCTHQHLHPHTP